ncbi:phage protease [Photobacterium sanguinicancri]|uniref:phage protease n=1 Tax=Photobacterium sanguinicancri TaxID=875932 RepID=UPI0026E2FDCE|nr:phage protease [Photobacterium sanguinicancri]MDO6497332.1 phage protease [Photobacterium sanguinicancri]
MKTSNRTQIAQAVLTANQTDKVAVLVADLNTHDKDGWVQLLPAGKFQARDGRPHDTEDGYWHLDAVIAAQMIAATKATSPKVVIDYEHQTLHAAENGKPAPAAGWLLSSTDIEWREGQGLYIKPDWTAIAQTHIDNDEYAFLSAVFPYDKQGRPLLLRMAAITNDPGVVGMDSLAALAADFNIHLGKPGVDINLYGSTEDSVLNEALKKLLARLGITIDGELTDELATAALTAFDALKAKADKADGLDQQIAVLSAGKKEVDLSKFVPIDVYNGVVGELAVLKAGNDEASIESVLKDARSQGKIISAEEEYLTQFGQQQGVAALKAMLEPRPAIAALTATQTSTTKVDADNKQDKPLDEQTLAILKATGVSKEQYLAQQKEDKDE